MKLAIIIITLAAATLASAQTDSQKCFTIKNDIDRKYCIDKYLESVKNKMAAEKKSWGASITGEAKQHKIEELNSEIQAKKDQKNLMDAEIALNEKHLSDLNSVAVSVPAPAKKKKDKKKDKKKLPFGIKL